MSSNKSSVPKQDAPIKKRSSMDLSIFFGQTIEAITQSSLNSRTPAAAVSTESQAPSADKKTTTDVEEVTRPTRSEKLTRPSIGHRQSSMSALIESLKDEETQDPNCSNYMTKRLISITTSPISPEECLWDDESDCRDLLDSKKKSSEQMMKKEGDHAAVPQVVAMQS
eukprot:CAMPEP_0118689242 /NCGR_PEP_ID=MMETSP0800-20121206/9376_1 /TAXON_ID=210618 ORGANISM="Striatella unipunctata, Strain CCMP2910" /NCGR_SAMPLE_ID=MMETSP0800 /ASSEMBLY_ACC=CAM_ASM_000638 /LENGTH=167 /DNA_ID=CAMNT_0006586609 /DNA_START=363 /DNA_END=866 /DNA_ORIENTATION=+